MDDKVIDPTQNPDQSNAIIAQLLKDASKGTETESRHIDYPTITAPPKTSYKFPCGVANTGDKYHHFEVKELNGRDEEKISKSRAQDNFGKWVTAVLLCGVKSVDDQPVTTKLLDSLLVGDRDYMLLAVREATYGKDIDLGTVVCPDCGEEHPAVVNTDDVKVERLEDDGHPVFDMTLRNGDKCKVTLPSGSDQIALLEDPDITDAERTSLLLRRVVVGVTYDGDLMPSSGLGSVIDEFGLVDRHSILKEIEKRVVGPRYDHVEIEHECGCKMTLPMGLVALFPGL